MIAFLYFYVTFCFLFNDCILFIFIVNSYYVDRLLKFLLNYLMGKAKFVYFFQPDKPKIQVCIRRNESREAWTLAQKERRKRGRGPGTKIIFPRNNSRQIIGIKNGNSITILIIAGLNLKHSYLHFYKTYNKRCIIE